MITLATPVDRVARISKKIIPALKRLGIKTIRDLLFYLPSRYEDFSNQKMIADVSQGETVTVCGRIKKVSNRRTLRKRMNLTEAIVEDETGHIKALWFNQPFLARNFRTGGVISLSGRVALGPTGLYLQNPAYEKVTSSSGIHTGVLVAIYPETRGISSRWLRFLIKTFIELRRQAVELLPSNIRTAYGLLTVQEAIHAIHFPKSQEEADRAERRFIFEELFLVQLRALRERLRLKQHAAPEIPFDEDLVKQFVASLPFKLTDAQRRSMWEIFKDMERPHPMNRLLEGDVGSGKTVVAAAATLLAKNACYQVVLMAPTEILARQHHATLKELLVPHGVSTGLLVGAEKKYDADTNVIIGTHALIQKSVSFENLGLVIVDEQHRFGVEQRAQLIKNNQSHLVPHFLSMTATPIPRTLALTAYGDLDLSVLDEMPPTRKPVITKLIEAAKRHEAYEFIRKKMVEGQQVFVVCPKIEPGIKDDTKTVKKEYEKLTQEIFSDFEVGMLHGKLKSGEKDAVMKKFKNKEIDILVSTSVVEVGVDVPGATIMIIEGAERFGLAQLHQFRGRVGRGEQQSYCFLFPTEDGVVSQRLRAVAESHNGFELAEKDLKIRGPGDIFGERQWGVPDLVLRGITDPDLVRAVRHEAVELLRKDPTLKEHPELQKKLEEIEQSVHLE